MRITGAIFDLDGTLLDSMPIWDNFGRLYLNSRGIAAPVDLGQTLKTMTLREAAAYFRKHFGIQESEDGIVARFGELLTREYRERVELKSGVRPFLRRLQREGVKMCVATATDRTAAAAALRRLGILEFFEFILTCAEAGCGKDAPDIYRMALNLLGTAKAETAVFEDALHAARTAKAAGFPVVGVYDPSSAADRAEITDLADRYVESFEEWEFDQNV